MKERAPKQLELLSTPKFGHGGRRPGAGRPLKPDAGRSHLKRSALDSQYPVHITTRLVPLPSLRRSDLFRVVRQAIEGGTERTGFRVIEFSVQADQIHLICEGSNRKGLARGIQGLLVRIARAINTHLGRRGRVFADRYHDRILRTPEEVRGALAFVLNNSRRQAAQKGRKLAPGYVDPCSSGPTFYGVGQTSVALPKARTWLLDEGWKSAGPVRKTEVPTGPEPDARSDDDGS